MYELKVLKIKIENNIKDVEKLYDFYLERYDNYEKEFDKSLDGTYFERRLNDLRVEKSTLEHVILMIEKQSGFEENAE